MTEQTRGRTARIQHTFPTIAAGIGLLSLSVPLLSGCGRWTERRAVGPATPVSPVAAKIVAGAKAEVRRGVAYDASYRVIAYPGGDVRADRGACTDVVIRALRHAGIDLQRLIHEDMRRRFSAYPQRYGASGPDANIDHRRVPNQITFFRRHGLELPRSTIGAVAGTWLPGDIVYWRLPNGPLHCGVLSDVRGESGLPLVIHNLEVAREEDCLAAWKIVGHFRYPVNRGLDTGGRKYHGGHGEPQRATETMGRKQHEG